MTPTIKWPQSLPEPAELRARTKSISGKPTLMNCRRMLNFDPARFHPPNRNAPGDLFLRSTVGVTLPTGPGSGRCSVLT